MHCQLAFCNQHFSLFDLVNMLIFCIHKLCRVHQLNVRHAVWLSHSGCLRAVAFSSPVVDFCNSMSPLLKPASSNLETYRNSKFYVCAHNRSRSSRATQRRILCMLMGMQCRAAPAQPPHTAACSRCSVPAERRHVSRQPCCITPTTALRT